MTPQENKALARPAIDGRAAELYFVGGLDREPAGNLLLLFRGFLSLRRSERARRFGRNGHLFYFCRFSGSLGRPGVLNVRPMQPL
jgi:hypothetical protein